MWSSLFWMIIDDSLVLEFPFQCVQTPSCCFIAHRSSYSSRHWIHQCFFLHQIWCFASLWRYYAKLHWSFSLFLPFVLYYQYVLSLHFQCCISRTSLCWQVNQDNCYVNCMEWMGVHVHVCMCVSIWKFMTMRKKSFEPFFSLVCFHGVFLCVFQRTVNILVPLLIFSSIL